MQTQASQSKPKQTQIAWSDAENNTLMDVINEKCRGSTSKIPWSTIVPEFQARMKKIDPNLKERAYRKIVEHYNQVLDPNIKNPPFTPEECQLILSMKNEGIPWPQIKKAFPSHSMSHIKNKYESL